MHHFPIHNYLNTPKYGNFTTVIKRKVSSVILLNVFYNIYVFHNIKDGVISLGGCDKTVPGVLMPLARLNAVSTKPQVFFVNTWMLNPFSACCIFKFSQHEPILFIEKI